MLSASPRADTFASRRRSMHPSCAELQKRGEFLLHSGKLRLRGEIVPLVRIVDFVVKLFAIEVA